MQATLAQLPWYHNIALLEKLADPAERLWYAGQIVGHGWSRNVLVHQIEGGMIRRQGRALTNFGRTLPSEQSELAQQLLKDPYQFDFLSLGTELLERQLERGLIEHMRDTILELGKGFSFVGSQYHLDVGGQDYYLDLLFYHLRLRCFVVIDLKVEEFKPEFAGKMNFYLSAVDDLLRHSEDRSSIGIILCKGRNEVVVEYALRDTTKPMGVARYQLTESLPASLKAELPTTEEFARDFPLFSLFRLRIEVEHALQSRAEMHGIKNIQGGIRQLLQELQRVGVLPPSASDLIEVVPVLNLAAHGREVSGSDVDRATQVVTQFLDELKNE